MYFLLIILSLLMALVMFLISCDNYQQGITKALECLIKEYQKTPKPIALAFFLLFGGILIASTFLYLILNPIGKIILLVVHFAISLFLLNYYYYKDRKKFSVKIYLDGRVESDLLGEEELKRISDFIKREKLIEEFFFDDSKVGLIADVICDPLIPFCLKSKEVRFYSIGRDGVIRKLACVEDACEPYRKLESFLKSFV